MDIDILKPDTGYLSVIERPAAASSKGSSSRQPSTGSDSPEFEGYTEPLSEGEEEEMDIAPAKNEGQRTGLSGAAVEEAIAFREQMLKRREEQGMDDGLNTKGETGAKNGGLNVPLGRDAHEEGSSTGGHRPHKKWYSFGSDIKTRTWSIDPLAPSTAFDETLKGKLHEAQRAQNGQTRTDVEEGGDEAEEEGDLDNAPTGDDRIMVRDWTAPTGKRISVPVRIEPKVYFAVERTFLVSHLSSIPSSFTL